MVTICTTFFKSIICNQPLNSMNQFTFVIVKCYVVSAGTETLNIILTSFALKKKHMFHHILNLWTPTGFVERAECSEQPDVQQLMKKDLLLPQTLLCVMFSSQKSGGGRETMEHKRIFPHHSHPRYCSGWCCDTPPWQMKRVNTLMPSWGSESEKKAFVQQGDDGMRTIQGVSSFVPMKPNL